MEICLFCNHTVGIEAGHEIPSVGIENFTVTLEVRLRAVTGSVAGI